jgi:glyoxylase-like metal-dependent hydrolase (beta-lactamase superfamily II)
MDQLSFTLLPVTSFAQNCAILRCEESGRGAVLDPGGDVDRILDAAAKSGTDLEKILITHAHLDHAGGAAELSEKAGLPIEGPHPADQFWIDAMEEQGLMFGLQGSRPFEPKRWLDEGDVVSVGNQELKVFHCPGHTPGHVVFFHPGDKLAFVGDVLFAGSIGRTDFPQGDTDTLIASIRQKIFPLGDDVRFACGHGPMSTIARERQTNPFVGDVALGKG